MIDANKYDFKFTAGEKQVFSKKPDITVSQWAEKYRIVNRGPKKGQWSNDLTPYLVLPMDMWNKPWVRRITLRFAPQTGKTQFAFNCLCFAIDHDPDAALYVMPDEKTAKRLSRRQILPMFKDTPRIAKLLSPRNDEVSTLAVQFQNGMDLSLAWATSAAELASESYKYVFFDEPEKYPAIAGREGDPVYLGEVRTTAFPHTHKILYFSTPNAEKGSIMRAESEMDQHFVYHAKCPVCGKLQQMVFNSIFWPSDKGYKTVRRKKLAEYQCANCAITWNDHMRDKAVAAGEWVADKPVDRPSGVSFYLPAWYSPFVSLSDVAADFIQGHKEPAKLKIFCTQRKAEPWKNVVIQQDEKSILAARCDLPPQIVPDEAVCLSAGIDVQKHGFWFAVRAWAKDYTSWLIHYGFLALWEDVDRFLFETTYPIRSGGKMRIWRAAIDTGGGKKYADMSMTEETYWWIRINGVGRGCRCYATKGSSRPLIGKLSAKKPIDKTPSGKPLPGGLQIISLDTYNIKDMFFYRLEQAVKQGSYAAYLHKETGNDYALQITAEEKRKDDRGAEFWKQVRKDNHLLDAECLAHIVVDPEWPGGGLNLLRQPLKVQSNDDFSSGARAQRVDKKAWLAEKRYERPAWLNR